MLNIYRDTWSLDPAICPCDIHFTEFLEDQLIRDSAIFHFGTGAHHLVGTQVAQSGRNNVVLGITASVGEYQTYTRLVIENPRVSQYYKAFFGDVYQLDARLLPRFDIVTLFHLCEFRTAENDKYGALTDLALAKLLIERIRPGGYVLFYSNSMAAEHASVVIRELREGSGIERCPDFKSLQIYRVPAA
jgi:hypothetical protein